MVQAYFEVKVKFRGVCEIFWQATDKNRSLVHQCFSKQEANLTVNLALDTLIESH